MKKTNPNYPTDHLINNLVDFLMDQGGSDITPAHTEGYRVGLQKMRSLMTEPENSPAPSKVIINDCTCRDIDERIGCRKNCRLT